MGKLREFGKKALIVACALYSLNSFSIPLLTYTCKLPSKLKYPRIQRVMETKEYVYDFKGNNQEVALKYLKLAHAVTMKYMSLGYYDFGTTTDEMLDSRVGNCSETAPFTYSNFFFLISESDKKDLVEYVRVANGVVNVDGEGGGHVWLEIKIDGEWVPYESVANDLSDDAEIVPEYIDMLVPDSEVLNLKNMKYHRTNMCYITKGGEEKYRLDALGMLTEYRGISWMMYTVIKDRSCQY